MKSIHDGSLGCHLDFTTAYCLHPARCLGWQSAPVLAHVCVLQWCAVQKRSNRKAWQEGRDMLSGRHIGAKCMGLRMCASCSWPVMRCPLRGQVEYGMGCKLKLPCPDSVAHHTGPGEVSHTGAVIAPGQQALITQDTPVPAVPDHRVQLGCDCTQLDACSPLPLPVRLTGWHAAAGGCACC